MFRELLQKNVDVNKKGYEGRTTLLERIYNPITAMGFSAMFTFQLDNTKR